MKTHLLAGVNCTCAYLKEVLAQVKSKEANRFINEVSHWRST